MIFSSLILHLCFSDSDHYFRQQIVRTGGICKSYFSILFHLLLPFLIRTSYYSDFLFSFTDFRKRKSVAAAEEGTPGKEAARERISFDTDEAERRFERRYRRGGRGEASMEA